MDDSERITMEEDKQAVDDSYCSIVLYCQEEEIVRFSDLTTLKEKVDNIRKSAIANGICNYNTAKDADLMKCETEIEGYYCIKSQSERHIYWTNDDGLDGLCEYITEEMDKFRFEYHSDDGITFKNLKLMSPLLYFRTIQSERFVGKVDGCFTWQANMPEYLFSNDNWHDKTCTTIQFCLVDLNGKPIYFVDQDDNQDITVKNIPADVAVENIKYQVSYDGNIVLETVPNRVWKYLRGEESLYVDRKHLNFVYYFGDENLGNSLLVRCIRSRDSWYKGGGFGGYNGRADSVDEVEYKWYGNLAFGVAMGLDIGSFRFLDSLEDAKEEKVYEEKVELIKEELIAQEFCETNYPRHLDWARNGLLKDFNILCEVGYFKKFRQNKKRKNLPDKFPAPHNLEFVSGGKDWKSSFRKKKKPNQLKHRESKQRQDAATVMGHELSGLFGGNKLPAKHFAKYVVGDESYETDEDKSDDMMDEDKSQDVFGLLKEDWKNHKKQTWNHFGNVDIDDEDVVHVNDEGVSYTIAHINEVRTSQEWCHLYGHGDGGREEYDNFVSGSNHCNTEQLAIETGQRVKSYPSLLSGVTAYLFDPGERVVPILKLSEFFKKLGYSESLSPLGTSVAYHVSYFNFISTPPRVIRLSVLGKNVMFNNETIKNVREQLDTKQKKRAFDKFISSFTLPLAKWIRYKIYDKSEGDAKKIFDHIFDAQSESFNQHEGKILDYTLRRMIEGARVKPGNALVNYQQEINKKFKQNINLLSEEHMIHILQQNFSSPFLVKKQSFHTTTRLLAQKLLKYYYTLDEKSLFNGHNSYSECVQYVAFQIEENEEKISEECKEIFGEEELNEEKKLSEEECLTILQNIIEYVPGAR